MFANFPKPLCVTDCFEYSISLDFVVLKFLLECLLFCSHNLWLPEQQTFLISDWQVPTMITGIFFYLFNSNALKFPSSFCCYSANLFLSFLALFHVFLLFVFLFLFFILFPFLSTVSASLCDSADFKDERLRLCTVTKLWVSNTACYYQTRFFNPK